MVGLIENYVRQDFCKYCNIIFPYNDAEPSDNVINIQNVTLLFNVLFPKIVNINECFSGNIASLFMAFYLSK